MAIPDARPSQRFGWHRLASLGEDSLQGVAWAHLRVAGRHLNMDRSGSPIVSDSGVSDVVATKVPSGCASSIV